MLATMGEVPSPSDRDVSLMLRDVLASVYRRTLDDDEVEKVRCMCPETHWLARCALMSPCPPGWRLCTFEGMLERAWFVCEITGDCSKLPPHALRYVGLTKLVLQAVSQPDRAHVAAAWVRKQAQDAGNEATRINGDWCSAIDEETGAEYWYSPVAACASWEEPTAVFRYFGDVCEHLLECETLRHEHVERLGEDVQQPHADEASIMSLGEFCELRLESDDTRVLSLDLDDDTVEADANADTGAELNKPFTPSPTSTASTVSPTGSDSSFPGSGSGSADELLVPCSPVLIKRHSSCDERFYSPCAEPCPPAHSM